MKRADKGWNGTAPCTGRTRSRVKWKRTRLEVEIWIDKKVTELLSQPEEMFQRNFYGVNLLKELQRFFLEGTP